MISKKIMPLFFLIICFLFTLSPVSAKEYCKVLSSDGRSIGTELACGTEHFYIIENNNNTISMLAKYNLLVGDKIDYFEIEGEKPSFIYYRFDSDGKDYCMNKAVEKGYNPYYVYAMGTRSDQNTVLDGCRVYEKLNPEHVRQDERAIGTKLDGNGKSILPLYGITYLNPYWGYEAKINNDIRNNDYDSNGDLVVSGTVFEDYLNGYKTELQSQGVAVSNVSFITLDRTINLLKNISNKEVRVELDYEDPNEIGDPYNNPEAVHVGKMDIKEYVPDNHKWIYGVTYWLGSGFKIDNNALNEFNDYYISNEGMLCALGRGECSFFAYPIGNGVRPLVTISSDDIEFLIRTKTDGHGTIEAIDHSPGGESIKFRVNSKKGYKLNSVTVTTDTGEKVSFKSGEIQRNSDGTMSIDKNDFTMPFENVTIEAKWILDIINPKTGNKLLIIVLSIIISSGIGTLLYKKKESRYKI